MDRFLGAPRLSSALQQVLDTTFYLPGTASGSVLDLIPAIPVLLATLDSIPELEAQSLCTVLQSPVDKLLGGRFDLLLQSLGSCMLLLDFLDALSPPVWRGRSRKTAPASPCYDVISDGRVVIS